eukprot:Skav213203  [mRNA]  locus=scaffold2826:421195:427301:+ [translate_table: standard]
MGIQTEETLTVTIQDTAEALRRNGWALRFASDRLKKDRSLVLEAIQNEAVAFRFAAEANGQAFLNGDALRYADEEFLCDVKVVRSAVRQNGMALRFAVPELRADLSLVTEATKNTPKAFAFVCGPLKWDRAPGLSACARDVASRRFFTATPSTRIALRSGWGAQRWGQDVVTIAVQQWASGTLKQDVSVALEAVKQDGSALQLVSEDVDFVISVVQSNQEAPWVKRAIGLDDGITDT